MKARERFLRELTKIAQQPSPMDQLQYNVPDPEQMFEQLVFSEAVSKLIQKFPKLEEKVVTVKMIYADPEGYNAVASIILDFNGHTFHIPVVVRHGNLKELFTIFNPDVNVFYPLTKDWLDRIEILIKSGLGTVSEAERQSRDIDLTEHLFPPNIRGEFSQLPGQVVLASIETPNRDLVTTDFVVEALATDPDALVEFHKIASEQNLIGSLFPDEKSLLKYAAVVAYHLKNERAKLPRRDPKTKEELRNYLKYGEIEEKGSYKIEKIEERPLQSVSDGNYILYRASDGKPVEVTIVGNYVFSKDSIYEIHNKYLLKGEPREGEPVFPPSNIKLTQNGYDGKYIVVDTTGPYVYDNVHIRIMRGLEHVSVIYADYPEDLSVSKPKSRKAIVYIPEEKFKSGEVRVYRNYVGEIAETVFLDKVPSTTKEASFSIYRHDDGDYYYQGRRWDIPNLVVKLASEHLLSYSEAERALRLTKYGEKAFFIVKEAQEMPVQQAGQPVDSAAMQQAPAQPAMQQAPAQQPSIEDRITQLEQVVQQLLGYLQQQEQEKQQNIPPEALRMQVLMSLAHNKNVLGFLHDNLQVLEATLDNLLRTLFLIYVNEDEVLNRVSVDKYQEIVEDFKSAIRSLSGLMTKLFDVGVLFNS